MAGVCVELTLRIRLMKQIALHWSEEHQIRCHYRMFHLRP